MPPGVPTATSQSPTTALHSLLVSPGWPDDRTLVGIWDPVDLLGPCWVLGVFGGPLRMSHDGGRTWNQPRSGVGQCEAFSAVATSPGYATDRALREARVVGLGLFASADGGQLWCLAWASRAFFSHQAFPEIELPLCFWRADTAGFTAHAMPAYLGGQPDRSGKLWGSLRISTRTMSSWA